MIQFLNSLTIRKGLKSEIYSKGGGGSQCVSFSEKSLKRYGIYRVETFQKIYQKIKLVRIANTQH